MNEKIYKIVMNILGITALIATCLGDSSKFVQIGWIVIALLGANSR